MRQNKKKINLWLLWGVIVLVVLLLIWLITFEYFNVLDAGAVMEGADKIEQTSSK